MHDLLGNVKANYTPAGEEEEDNPKPRRSRRARQAAQYQEEDVEMGVKEPQQAFEAPPTEQDVAMKQFFAVVEGIKEDLKQLRILQQEVNQLHDKSKTLVKSKDVQKVRQQLQDKISDASGAAHKIKAKIEALDKGNLDARKLKGQQEGTAAERTRTSVTASLKKKFKDQMGEFSALRNQIQDEYREVVERRVYTVTGQKVSEEEIDRMIETGEAENIFQKAILSDQQGRGRVLDTLAEIQERHRAVRDLEQGLLELHQMFLDMAVLVETQGEMLNNIEKQVGKCVDYVQDGVTAIEGAKEYQKKTRKMMCCAFIIVLIVALIIVLAVVQPWKFIR